MRIDSFAQTPWSLLVGQEKSGAGAAASVFAGAKSSAESAVAPSILPAAQAQPLSFETVLALQARYEPEAEAPKPPSAEALFLEEARKPPMQRLREQILDELGLTEESLASLPADERRAIEDTLREMIEEKFRQAAGVDDGAPQTNAEVLQTLS